MMEYVKAFIIGGLICAIVQGSGPAYSIRGIPFPWMVFIYSTPAIHTREIRQPAITPLLCLFPDTQLFMTGSTT